MAKKSYFGKRRDLFAMDPDDVVVIGVDTEDGKSHPLWDKRAFGPIDEALVANIRTYGVLEPVIVQKDGDRATVVDGRRRVLHARRAKQLQETAGEITVTVPVLVKRGTESRIFGISRSANEHRKDDGLMTKAENAQRMLDYGATEDDVAVTFGVEVQTVNIWLRLLDTDKSVRDAVDAGEISASAASRLTKLSKDEQKAALAEAKSNGTKLTTARASAAAKAKKTKTDARTAPGKRALRKIVESGGIDSNVLLGIRYALGDVPATRISGLTAVLRDLGIEG